MGMTSNKKGKRGEREARKFLKETLEAHGFKIVERANSGAVGGGGNGDIAIFNPKIGRVDFKVEVKRYKAFADYALMEKDGSDILMKRGDNKEWLVTFTWPAFEALLDAMQRVNKDEPR